MRAFWMLWKGSSSPSLHPSSTWKVFQGLSALTTKSFLSDGNFSDTHIFGNENLFLVGNFPSSVCVERKYRKCVRVGNASVCFPTGAKRRAGKWWEAEKWKCRLTQKDFFSICAEAFSAVSGQLFVGWDRPKRRSFPSDTNGSSIAVKSNGQSS